MIVHRWSTGTPPTETELKSILEREGLEVKKEILNTNQPIVEHKHPFTEVRIVEVGEFLINISGTQLLLRTGDRIEIPANTKHSHKAKTDSCSCLVAYRAF